MRGEKRGLYIQELSELAREWIRLKNDSKRGKRNGAAN